jgi:hypothetical protein
MRHLFVHRLGVVCFILCIIACIGCSGSASIQSWQKQVDQYVREQGNGDPGVLREVEVAEDRIGFAVLGSSDPRHSTDAVAVLVGHREIADRAWFVYLVGLVEDETVKDIRVAALNVEGARSTWRLSQSDAASLHRYVEFATHQWQQRFPNRNKAPPGYSTFPRSEDRFELETNGEQVSVIHPPSQARWQVSLTTKH